jgi:hypothetical protein
VPELDGQPSVSPPPGVLSDVRSPFRDSFINSLHSAGPSIHQSDMGETASQGFKYKIDPFSPIDARDRSAY